jgi:dTDP-4-amino-4,6-dideoxygalactose transaminase
MTFFSDPKAQYLSHRTAIHEAVDRVFDSGWYILGREVEAFEAEFAAYCGADHGVGVGNGTDALAIALEALGIGRGDEVITVSHTAVATAAAIRHVGAEPVFVDIEPVYYMMDPGALEQAISSRTRAVIPVHLYGQCADMSAIMTIARKHDLFVIEDCAQAAGATFEGKRLGIWGDIGCFSFYPTKNLGALGDAGMAITNDPSLAQRMRSLREYGWNENRISEHTGGNSRLDELQAAILRAKLPALDTDNGMRRQHADAYDLALSGGHLTLPARRPGASHVFHLYVIACDNRNDFSTALKQRGINPGIHYPVPIHCQPAYNECRTSDDLPNTCRAAETILSLPIYPELDSNIIDQVRETARQIGAVA